MNELAQKIAQILGVSADKIGSVYPDMIRAWAFESRLFIGFGVVLLLVSWGLTILGLNSREEGQFFALLGAVIMLCAGCVFIIGNLASAVYPEATFVRSLMYQVKH